MLLSKRSFGSILDANKGVGQGFDTMRVTLSISILCWHSYAISYGREAEIVPWSTGWGTILSSLLPVFFALSGFLVMGSASRAQSLRTFVVLRGLRIVPALATEITLSALLIGTALTVLPLSEYFSDHRFFAYFGSLFGRIRVTLPGVFAHNPAPDLVNISLWTIGPELLCYVYLAVMIVSGAVRHRWIVTAFGCAFVGADFLRDQFGSFHHEIGQSLLPRSLIVSFILGNLAYLWRHKLPYHWLLFLACLAVGLGTIHLVHWEDMGLVALTYCTVFLGVTPIKKIPVLSGGDYSYGIYLYAYAIQQAVAYLLPGLREFYWNILISLPIVIALAMCSWRFVEEPTLSLRKRLTSQPGAVPTRLSGRNLALIFVFATALLTYGAYLASLSSVIPPAYGLGSSHAPLLLCAIVAASLLLTGMRAVLSKAEPAAVRARPALNLAFNESGAGQ